ncbi:hypothetical protein DYB36_001442 [Aphanomyces astaci]|uniref:1-phosphatidylinositol-3-phosphate 5-kinase n=1 Tax=Aphanomyces astaci TaxID=112090 RepID=A0A397AQF8_APHAT|nr:hypothetical protein DYB36_001442 [Aphanomyces astaci]
MPLFYLIGLLNAIVYGGVVQAVRRLVFGVDTRGSDTRMTNNCSELSTSFIRDDVPGVTISVFATTFNLGEGHAPDDMVRLLSPPIIMHTECLHLTELRAAVKGFLERCTHTTFAEYSRDIGSKNTVLGYHGFIGITVFVPETDVNCGKTLNFRTSNKGGVGFAFRYLDTSIAVVSCHLSSDSKVGKSNMERRNEDATLIWQSLHLSGDAMGVEFPSLHHHTIVMGDLNYRLTRFHASPHEVVDLVAHALSQKKWPLQQRLSAQSAPDSSGMTILSSFPQLPLASSPSSHSCLSSTPPDRRTRFHRRTVGAWTPVLKHDELLMCMEDGLAVITFPPTFRRLRHTSLLTSCDVASAYSLESANGGGPRVPSYTDRILYHSLADVEGDLECTEYRCHESIDVSDHKPVSCVFHITTKAHRFPLPSPPPPHALDGTAIVEEDDRVRDVVLEVPDDGDRHWLDRASMTASRVRECIIVLNQLRWMPTKKPSDVRRGSSDDILSQKWDDPKQYIELCTLFPLPLEDIFAEQRKLHQLAASWRMGLVGGSSADGRSKYLNHMRVPWMSVREKGVVHRCFAQAKRHMHIALDIRGPTMSLGQCALSLDAAFVKLNVHMPFEEALSTGGIKAGVLKGRVMLTSFPQPGMVSNVEVCSACGESFNIFRRRHHCRACGGIFCHSCSPYAAEAIEQGVKTHVRNCKRCHQRTTLTNQNATEVAADFPPGLMSPLVSQTVFDYGNIAGFDLELDVGTLSDGVADAAAVRTNSLYQHLSRRPSFELASALKAIHDAEEHLDKSSSSMLEIVDEDGEGGRSSSIGYPDEYHHHRYPDCCHSPPPLSSTKSKASSARPSFTDGTIDGHQWPLSDHTPPFDPAPATPLEAHQMASRRQIHKLLARAVEDTMGTLLPDAADRRAVLGELERLVEDTTALLVRATYSRNAVDGMFNHQDLLHVKTIAEVPDDDTAPTSSSLVHGQVIHGIVCRKNVSHKKAPRWLEHPRVLLLGGSIVTDRESAKLTKFEDLINDEAAYAQQLVDKILSLNPTVVFVEHSVSRLAQDQLQQHNIALVLKVKGTTLQRLARLTRATMVPSIDAMRPEDTSVLGTSCRSFAVVPTKVVDPVRNVYVITSCLCPNKAVLRALKALVLQVAPQAYDLMLRAQALSDLAYPVPSLDEDENAWTVQVIKYMLKHRDEVHKPKFSQCSRPQPHKVAFYSKHDKALGSYLQKEGIDSSTKCQVPNCKVPLIEHLEAYSFLNGTVLISTERMPDLARSEIERTEGQHAADTQPPPTPQPPPSHGACVDDDAKGPTIFFWRHCLECSRMVTPPRLLPVSTLKFSFARFLETIFRVPGPQATSCLLRPRVGSSTSPAAEAAPVEGDDAVGAPTEDDVGCPHDGQTQHLLYFKCGKRAIRVEYMQHEPWYIQHDNCLHFDQRWYVDHQRQQATALKAAVADHFAALLRKIKALPAAAASRDVMCLELLVRTSQTGYLADLTLLEGLGEILAESGGATFVVDANSVRRAFYHSCCEWSTMLHKITATMSANATPEDMSDATTSMNGEVEGPVPTPARVSSVVGEPEGGVSTLEAELELPPLSITVKEPTMGAESPVSWTTALSNSLGAILLGDKKDEPMADRHHDVPEAFAGGHPFLPAGAHHRVVFVYDHLRFSYVAYALNSTEYAAEVAVQGGIAPQSSVTWQHQAGVEDRLKSAVDTTVKLKFAASDVDFMCQVHYALQFEALRTLFYGDTVDFIKSLATSEHWSAKGGKSGATFFRTADDRFVIKYISQVELQSFLASAVSYFAYIAKVHFDGVDSVLSKLVGVFTVTTKRWTEHLVVMENVFSKATTQIDHVYDLKGSTRNRYLDPPHDVLLDGNFLERHLGLPCPLHCRSYDKLVEAIRNDVHFLSDNNIMDYSLVIGYAPEVPVNVDDHDGTNHDVTTNRVLLVGIIDYLRHFDFLKRMESVGKSVTMIAGQAAPTVVQPKQYAKRFVDALEQTYFMPVPSFTEQVYKA